MNFTKAFTYIFDDPRWLEKLVIPLLVTLIPVIGWMVAAGYLLRVTRNVAEHQVEPLPELEFGADLSRGFKMFVANLLYGLPIVVVSTLLFLPLGLSGNSGSTNFFAIALAILGGLLILLYALFVAIIMPAVNANLAVKEQIGAAFEFKEIFRMIGNNFKAWLIVIGGTILCNVFIAPIGGIILVVGAIITGFYSQLIIAHLTGQAYAHSQAPGGQDAPLY
ncbi:MAG: DUF4013 domain-containing protein [Anaerolineaceae bacterium]